MGDFHGTARGPTKSRRAVHEERRHEVRAPHSLLLLLTVVWEASTPRGRNLRRGRLPGFAKARQIDLDGRRREGTPGAEGSRAGPVSHGGTPTAVPGRGGRASLSWWPGPVGGSIAEHGCTAALRLAEQGSDSRPLVESSSGGAEPRSREVPSTSTVPVPHRPVRSTDDPLHPRQMAGRPIHVHNSAEFS